MGKRKKKTRKPPPKRAATEPLQKLFNCPFCNHESSCEVTLQKQKEIGHIKCRICGEEFQTRINHLSEAVDVYSEWIDECERANT